MGVGGGRVWKLGMNWLGCNGVKGVGGGEAVRLEGLSCSIGDA